MSGISTTQEAQIKELIAKGQKVSAVKLYREMTGVGLREAKDAVDAIEHGGLAHSHAPIQSNQKIDMVLEDQIRQLLAKRQKIQAVKIYREAHDCGLKDAKDAVDAIEVQMRTETHLNLPSAPAISNDPFAEDTERNRRFLAFMLAIVLLVIGGAAFFLLAGNGF